MTRRPPAGTALAAVLCAAALVLPVPFPAIGTAAAALLPAQPGGGAPADESPTDQADQADRPAVERAALRAGSAGSSDPVSIWPDPLNETQLGGDDSYYFYARADRRSLLPTPTSERPLRIWVGGDSMSGGAVYGLTRLLEDDPGYTVTSDVRKSTGNVSDWYFDWPQYMETTVAEAGYDVIVLTIGANDKQRIRGVSGPAGSPAWVADYLTRVDALVGAAVRPGRLVVWVGLPHMQPRYLRGLPDLVNPLVASVADAYPEAHFVDAAAVVSPDGEYVRRLGGEHGRRSVRTSDGVHYTFYGGELVAAPVIAEIERRSG
ncbi:MAG TPA: hypothetical protein DEP66_01280 [Acidimicrobiaceae bacterium]|nr:hypothetical protein [Acidimicrobiaceae bacterium]